MRRASRNRRRILPLAVALSVVLSLTPATAAPAHATPGLFTWMITNYTGHPIWGRFEVFGFDDPSPMDIPKTDPLRANARGMYPPKYGRVTIDAFHEVYMSGQLCYLGSWWHLERKAYMNAMSLDHEAGAIMVDLVSEPGVLFLHLSQYQQQVNRVNMTSRSDAVPGDGCVMQQ